MLFGATLERRARLVSVQIHSRSRLTRTTPIVNSAKVRVLTPKSQFIIIILQTLLVTVLN